MTDFRIVLDTNVYISAIIFGGMPEKILDLAKERGATAYTSSEILLELTNKLQKKFSWDDSRVKFTINNLSKSIKLVKPHTTISVVEKDRDDNIIIECAMEAKAHCIVTGDKHLLDIKRYEGIIIVTPSKFLKVFEKKIKTTSR